ncbi:MAG: dephospho-CoA kinase [Rudaea sp.]|nr:dephospho-CoA kinase [Rudaea sp.]
MNSANPCAYSVALTGGVASGKSTVADRFRRLGTSVFDADVVARALVAPGEPALAEIVAAFGDDIVDAAGDLDRSRLRKRVFEDNESRLRLEAILHPRIRAALRAQAQTCATPYCVLVIPLLAESRGAYTWVDRVLVVDAPPAVQIARLMQRDGATRDLALRMLASQASRAQRLALADDVIDNADAHALLDDVVARLHRRYLTLAAEKSRQ